MKYIEKYLKDIIKVKPLGTLTTEEDELDGISGEMVYIDGKCSDIFISHIDYANWLEKQGEQKPFDYEDVNIQQKDFAPKSAMEAIKEEKIDNTNKVEPKDYNSIDPHFGKPADLSEPQIIVEDHYSE